MENKDIQRQCKIAAMQTAFERYTKANAAYWQSLFIDDNGKMCFAGDINQRLAEIKVAKEEYEVAGKSYFNWCIENWGDA